MNVVVFKKDRIGQGSFGYTHRAQMIPSGQVVAVKICILDDGKEDLARERDVYQMLDAGTASGKAVWNGHATSQYFCQLLGCHADPSQAVSGGQIGVSMVWVRPGWG